MSDFDKQGTYRKLLKNAKYSRALYFRANSRTREFRENLVLANILHFSRAFYRYLVCQNRTIIKEVTGAEVWPPLWSMINRSYLLLETDNIKKKLKSDIFCKFMLSFGGDCKLKYFVTEILQITCLVKMAWICLCEGEEFLINQMKEYFLILPC